MAIADAEIEDDFCMTREEIAESMERDDYVLDGQLTFRDLARKRCNQAYQKRYYSEHKAALKEKMAKRYAKNRDAERERSRKWKEKNSEYVETYQKAYYRENREDCILKATLRGQVNRAYRKIMAEMEAEGA